MGLAAGQARLLTITGRKSDCEFESMRLSHQKIALSRELTDVSNEYQDSLNQTKLVYDYYGTGDTSTQLSYGILMYPSALNNYMPTLITDPSGRAVLNSKYAAAARAAGIPQEGLGTLPSEEMRNAFIAGLAGAGIITDKLAETITGLPYNQAAGFGGGATVAVTTQDVTYEELANLLNTYSAVDATNSSYNELYVHGINLYNNTDKTVYINASNSGDGNWKSLNGVNYEEATNGSVTLGNILNGDYVLIAYGADEYNAALGATGGAIDAVVNSAFWDTMFETIEDVLDTGDSYTQAALAYARSQIEYLISNQCTQKDTIITEDNHKDKSTKSQYNNDTDLANFAFHSGGSNQEKDVNVMANALEWASASSSVNGSDGYIGLVCRFNCGKGRDDDSDMSAISVNLSSVLKAYLTYFVDYMNGVSKTDSNGVELYDVNDTVAGSHLVDDSTMFTVKIGSEVSSDDLGQATFYDALFNQICANGWTENNNIEDNDYLQQMLQNGMMFISTVKDDNYYYQGNYATYTYIKEISDETKIAYAEAKYNTEKAKLNAKEETIDLKMKNLDTEISSLTTEYDTVKNTISKQIERSFKRYNA